MKIRTMVLAVLLVLSAPAAVTAAKAEEFSIKPLTSNDFSVFTKVFAEMRGPLRSEILKNKATNFENADPLQYMMKIKETKDVKKALSSAGLTWNQFEELMGNVLLGYYGSQPDKTKSAMIKQLAGYGFIPGVPEEYAPMVKELLKTKEGSDIASIALEMAMEIPEASIAIAKANKTTLDQLFYTKYWVDKL